MKRRKKIILVIVIVLLVIVAVLLFGYLYMSKITEDALDKQVNVEIDMNQVKDGTYLGSSDGGTVKVEVSVEVINHKITKIQLLKHDNGMGKPAEAMIDDMIAQIILML